MTRTHRTGIAVLALALGACGHAATTATVATTVATNPVVTTRPAARVAIQPTPVVTTPDLSDVDKALADIDSDIAGAERDAPNEGAPTQ